MSSYAQAMLTNAFCSGYPKIRPIHRRFYTAAIFCQPCQKSDSRLIGDGEKMSSCCVFEQKPTFHSIGRAKPYVNWSLWRLLA